MSIDFQYYASTRLRCSYYLLDITSVDAHYMTHDIIIPKIFRPND